MLKEIAKLQGPDLLQVGVRAHMHTHTHKGLKWYPSRHIRQREGGAPVKIS